MNADPSTSSGTRPLSAAPVAEAPTPAAEAPTPAAEAPTPVAEAPRAVAEPVEASWGLWEVFVRANRGLSHVHVGSLQAPDAEMAVRNARDVYTRRNEGISIWVVPADAITTSDPDARDAFFESPSGKNYRHARYYTASEGVPHL